MTMLLGRRGLASSTQLPPRTRSQLPESEGLRSPTSSGGRRGRQHHLHAGRNEWPAETDWPHRSPSQATLAPQRSLRHSFSLLRHHHRPRPSNDGAGERRQPTRGGPEPSATSGWHGFQPLLVGEVRSLNAVWLALNVLAHNLDLWVVPTNLLRFHTSTSGTPHLLRPPLEPAATQAEGWQLQRRARADPRSDFAPVSQFSDSPPKPASQ